jgi:hypothetical protein
VEKVVYHHLGLGDHLICFSLVMELTKGRGYLYCKRHNIDSVTDLYNGTNIRLIAIDNDLQVLDYDYKIGFTKQCEIEENFGEEFYRQAGLKYEDRWKHKPIIQEGHCYTGEQHDIVICDSPEFIVDKKGYRPNGKSSIFEYIGILENAKEIHCIESSFKQLIEYINPLGKLYYHFNPKKSWRQVKSRHQWQVINY